MSSMNLGGHGGGQRSWPRNAYEPGWAGYATDTLELLIMHLLSRQRGYRVTVLSHSDRVEGLALLMDLIGFPADISAPQHEPNHITWGHK